MTKKDINTVKSAVKILKKSLDKRCKDYALGCFNCGMYRAIDDVETWVELGVE